MFMDAGNEHARDQLAEHLDELAAQREEEILWLSELLHRRTGVERLVVLRVLQERDVVLAEADSQP